MGWTPDEYITAFDTEAGDIATLATDAQKVQWFNMAQTRLLRFKNTYTDITWAAGDRSVTLPTDWVQLDKIDFDSDTTPEPWRVAGDDKLVLDDEDGATAAGSARVWYWAFWTEMVKDAGAE